MYAVVGCNGCATMWLLTDPETSETATCPRCQKQHRTDRLKRFFESEDREAAREARSALLAKKHGDSEAFAEVEHASELAARAEDSGIDDREYLEGVGLDPDEIGSTDDHTASGSGGASGGRSRLDVVRDAVDAVEDPTEESIVSYATADGVPAEAARDLLERLRRRGEVSESGGTYRRL
ncbi:DUF5817 domain-containing protein [Halopenitus sp. POP-27]|uniref:DUF5817 domain-containing protein n=1 Tax=Halopenitus sp. POP-27 TaxID=2994425 RepID=UPI002468DFAD|nr:DUF5817 domain-containing protein [Halopenitus sp. POP-27]